MSNHLIAQVVTYQTLIATHIELRLTYIVFGTGQTLHLFIVLRQTIVLFLVSLKIFYVENLTP